MAVAGKNGDNGVAEFQFYQPDNRTKWEAFQRAIYDKSTNQFFGRTPKNWGQLLVFYSIFYIVLAALFAICMQGLFATLADKEPRWKLKDSLIGDNPGVSFRPLPDKTEEGSLLWYNITNATTINRYVTILDKFLEPYQKNQTGQNYVPCHFDKLPAAKEVCKTDLSEFGKCTSKNMYGYNSSSPCIFVKLNRIFDWVPKYYTTPQPGMPADLVQYINEIQQNKSSERRVWVTCNGIDDFDKESIQGFNYHPKGFASYYYPYKNVDNYLSPIVAVEILNVKTNTVINIECRAWASNIVYKGGSLNRVGSVKFEIQIDREYQPPKIIPKSDSLTKDAAPAPVLDNKSTVTINQPGPTTPASAGINKNVTTKVPS